MRLRPLICAAVLLTLRVSAGETESLLARGEKLLEEGRIPEAVQTLRQAVAAHPESSLAYTRLGGAQVLSQDYGGGIDSFKQAIGLDPKNADAFVGLAVAYIHSARYPLARAALVEAKRLDPSKTADADRLIAWIDQRTAP